MKKFISFVMAAAMVASLVPATAFAANGDVTATAKVVDAWTRSEDAMDDNKNINGPDVPELQLKITGTDYQQTPGDLPVKKVTVTLGNADFAAGFNVDDIDVFEDGDRTTSVVGNYSDNAGASVTPAAQQDEDYDTTEEVAAALYAGTLPDNIAIWKDADNYTLINENAADFAADHQVDEEKATPSYEERALDAFIDYLADNGTVITAGTAAIDDTNWDTYFTRGQWNGNDAFIAIDAKKGELTNPITYVLDSQLTIAAADKYTQAEILDEIEAKLEADANYTADTDYLPITVNAGEPGIVGAGNRIAVAYTLVDDNEIEITFTGYFEKDDVIAIDLRSVMDRTSKNATVSVDSKMVTADDLAYVVVEDTGFTASVKKTVAVAEEEKVYLNSNGLKLKETVQGSFRAQDGEEISLKLSKGFEFVDTNAEVWVNGHEVTAADNLEIDGDKITFDLDVANMVRAQDVDEDGLVTLAIYGEPDGADDRGLYIEATSAKADDVATITAKVGALDKVSVEVAKAVEYTVIMSVDEDEDVPVIYSGVNVDNDGITDDSDHMSLEITLEETFPGAWSSRQGFTITVPDGVYVTDVDYVDSDEFYQDEVTLMGEAQWLAAFREAYQDGDHKNFEFGKRVFDDVDHSLNDDPAYLTFRLELVADPDFEGDVEIGFEGALVDTQSVVAAKFVAPYTVTAEQNDLKIDSRYTTIPTSIVVKETADGLWDDSNNFPAIFVLGIEKGLISFEDDATFTVDKDSELEIEDDMWDMNGRDDALSFEVTDTSDKAATVTISDMELFMERNIPAGAYALELNTSMLGAAERNNGVLVTRVGYLGEWLYAGAGDEVVIDDVTDYDNTVRENFINVITAPRDEDGFTTKITVPVGESYIIAGEVKVEIDTPAYINANGYTMLPLRAVAVALGIDNNSVLWDQSTRTATILYGNRVVSMQNGAKVMYINGQAVATKAGVEITNDRTFLSLRDLGTAMNVTDISWDAATRTAYLNAGVTEQA